MTGLFDFVLWIIPLSVKLDFADVVEDVLKEVFTRNQNKNFRVWFGKTTTGCESVPIEEVYMNFNIDDLDVFFSRFHDLDHAHDHKVWCRVSYNILYQFKQLFRGHWDSLEQDGFIWEKNFRTLRKYVQSINGYIARFYNKDKWGVYRLKEEKE